MNSTDMFSKIGYELEENHDGLLIYVKYTDISETKIMIDEINGIFKKKRMHKWETYLTWSDFTTSEILACARLIQERKNNFGNKKM